MGVFDTGLAKMGMFIQLHILLDYKKNFPDTDINDL